VNLLWSRSRLPTMPLRSNIFYFTSFPASVAEPAESYRGGIQQLLS